MHMEEKMKKKKTKKQAGMMLALSLVLLMQGCERKQQNTHTIIYENGEKQTLKDATQEVVKGRYMEKEVTLPADFKADRMQLLPDKRLVLLDIEQNGKLAFSDDNGANWKVEQNYLWKELKVGGREVLTMAVSPEGDIFISYMDWNTRQNKNKSGAGLVCTDKEGKRSHPQITFEERDEYVEKALYTQTGVLFVQTNEDRIYEVDLKEESARCRIELSRSEKSGFYAYDDSIVATNEKSVFFYQAQNGRIGVPDKVLNEFYREEGGLVLCGGADRKLYAACRDGIYSHTYGGNLLEQIADGTLNNLGNPSKVPVDIAVTEEGKILILYEDGELDSYVYDADVEAMPDRQLTIYSFYDNDRIRKHIREFYTEHPDVYVKLESSVAEVAVREDVLKNLKLELAAGGGPDLVLLDAVSVRALEKEGLLEAEKCYFSGGLLAVNASSKEKVLAKSFLETTLDETED